MTDPDVRLSHLIAEVARQFNITPVEAYQLLVEVRFDLAQLVRLSAVSGEVRFDLTKTVFLPHVMAEVRHDRIKTVFAAHVVGEVMWIPHVSPVVKGIYLYDCVFERPEGIALSACVFERPEGVVTGGSKYG